MHWEQVQKLFENQFATMEARLLGMEQAVGDPRRFQDQMVEF